MTFAVLLRYTAAILAPTYTDNLRLRHLATERTPNLLLKAYRIFKTDSYHS